MFNFLRALFNTEKPIKEVESNVDSSYVFNYLGYSSEQMIAYIGKFNYSTTLSKCGSMWELEVIGFDGVDNFYSAHTLIRVLIEAFEPHRCAADIGRKKARDMFYGGDGAVAERSFLKKLKTARLKKKKGEG